MTADGKYFLDGNVYDMSTRENLTEQLRTKARVAMINAVPESQMLIFSPKNPQYTITVFTDVDCQYCRKLHSEMAGTQQAGHTRAVHVLSAYRAQYRELAQGRGGLVLRPTATRR